MHAYTNKKTCREKKKEISVANSEEANLRYRMMRTQKCVYTLSTQLCVVAYTGCGCVAVVVKA